MTHSHHGRKLITVTQSNQMYFLCTGMRGHPIQFSKEDLGMLHSWFDDFSPNCTCKLYYPFKSSEVWKEINLLQNCVPLIINLDAPK